MKSVNFKILLPVIGYAVLVVSVLALQNAIAGIGLGLAGLLIFGPNVIDIRGKTGGIVYAKSKSGPYSKARIRGKNPQSAAQQANRQKHRDLMKLWKTEAVDKVAFNNYAASHPVQNRMGSTTHLSGINWFVRINRYARKANPEAALITKPPITDTLFPFLTGLNVTAISTPESVIIEPLKIGEYVEGMRLDVWATMQLSPGVFSPTGFRSIGVFDPNSIQTSVFSIQSIVDGEQVLSQQSVTGIDITANYVERFGDLQSGLKIFIKARLIMPTGEANLFVPGSSVVH